MPSIDSLLFPPSCFDYASGLNGLPGTPIPNTVTGVNGQTKNVVMINNAGNIVPVNISPSTFVFEEYSDSPVIESSEQSTIVHRYYADTYTAQALLLTNPRGTVALDSQGFYTRVLSSRITPIPKSGHALWNVEITSEAMGGNEQSGLPNSGQYVGFSTPPDEFSCDSFEINPPAEKHPRYACMTYQDRWNVRNADVSDNIQWSDQFYQLIQSSTSNKIANGVDPTLANNQASASLELLNKKHNGEDSFYLGGYKITWSSYFWYPPYTGLNPGGYIEDPVAQGGLPYQFWSYDGTNNQNANIFSIAPQNCPNLYQIFFSSAQNTYGISWLRQMDSLSLQRTWFKLTRTWVGAPLGIWDQDWYGSTFTGFNTNPNNGVIIGANPNP